MRCAGRPLNGLNANPVDPFMMPLRHLAAVALVVAATCSAFAADPVFPPGGRVGMTPLVGLVKAKSFIGFETEDQGVKVLVTDLPAEAYGEVANAFKANPGGTGGVKPESIETSAGLAYYTVESAKDGATNVRRYSMILPGPTFSGYVAVQVPENASKIYTDDAVRQMFASAAIRNEVPVDEQLGLMPFKVDELSAFKNVRMLAPGAALILADSDEKAGFEAAPFMIIGIIGSTAASPDDRGRFAQQIATTIPGVRDGRITMSEPIRIDGQAGYETRIDATSGRDNTPLPSCNGCGSAPRVRFASSAARRATIGPKRFRVSAPCVTGCIRASSFLPRPACGGRQPCGSNADNGGLGMATIATVVSERLGAATPIKPDDASALLVIDVSKRLPAGRQSRGQRRRAGRSRDQPHRQGFCQCGDDAGLAHAGPHLVCVNAFRQEAVRGDRRRLRQAGAVARSLRAGDRWR